MHVYSVLKRPVITEKSNILASDANQYSFVVDRHVNKIQVKDAVETAFNVTVLQVRVINIPAKKGRYGRSVVTRKPAYKKAIVTLAPGDSIPFFEGV